MNILFPLILALIFSFEQMFSAAAGRGDTERARLQRILAAQGKKDLSSKDFEFATIKKIREIEGKLPEYNNKQEGGYVAHLKSFIASQSPFFPSDVENFNLQKQAMREQQKRNK